MRAGLACCARAITRSHALVISPSKAAHDSGRVACVSAVSYFTVVSKSVNCSCKNGTDAPIARVHTKMFLITNGRSCQAPLSAKRRYASLYQTIRRPQESKLHHSASLPSMIRRNILSLTSHARRKVLVLNLEKDNLLCGTVVQPKNACKQV